MQGCVSVCVDHNARMCECVCGSRCKDLGVCVWIKMQGCVSVCVDQDAMIWEWVCVDQDAMIWECVCGSRCKDLGVCVCGFEVVRVEGGGRWRLFVVVNVAGSGLVG